MKIITISREYGAGGGEVARGLAAALGWELLDRNLLHQAAEVEHVPDSELQELDEKAISLADRFRLHPPHERYLHGLTEATMKAAARGNVILVGRGTRQILGDAADAFHLRLVAPARGAWNEWPASKAGRPRMHFPVVWGWIGHASDSRAISLVPRRCTPISMTW